MTTPPKDGGGDEEGFQASGLLNPDLAWTRPGTGEVVFAMKRKAIDSPAPYYLFEARWDNMPADLKQGIDRVWGEICAYARAFGFALIDYKDVEREMKPHFEGAKRASTVGAKYETELRVFDHAHGKEIGLFVDLTANPVDTPEGGG